MTWLKGAHSFTMGGSFSQFQIWLKNSTLAPAITFGMVSTDPAAGLFTVQGVGFVAAKTEVLLGSTALQRVGAAPAAGQFRVNPAGTTITFRIPAGLASGRHGVRVRVNQVESDPSWWVDVP